MTEVQTIKTGIVLTPGTGYNAEVLKRNLDWENKKMANDFKKDIISLLRACPTGNEPKKEVVKTKHPHSKEEVVAKLVFPKMYEDYYKCTDRKRLIQGFDNCVKEHRIHIPNNLYGWFKSLAGRKVLAEMYIKEYLPKRG